MISKFQRSLIKVATEKFSLFSGDIKILSESKSFHPVQSIPSAAANNISLPDLSEVEREILLKILIMNNLPGIFLEKTSQQRTEAPEDDDSLSPASSGGVGEDVSHSDSVQ